MERLHQLAQCKTIEDSKLYLRQFMDFLFQTIETSKYYHAKSDADCLLLVQMLFTRVNCFYKLLDGFDYHFGNVHLNEIIDHSTLFSIVRDIYEALCTFELIFVLPQTTDEEIIAYNTFVAAGLKERQGLNIDTDAARAVKAEELVEWEEIKNTIHNTQLYKQLAEDEKKVFDNTFNSTHPIYRWHIDENGKLKKVSWEYAYKLIGLKEETFSSIYNFLSLHTHPTSLSLRQFRDSFLETDPAFVWETCFACKIVSILLSVYIADLGLSLIHI